MKKKKKIRSLVDYFMGVSRVDNEANPDSALNRNKRKPKAPINWQARQKKQEIEKAYENTTVFGTPYK